jgi:glycosyltransferase involved in cell wall biosynthesis
MRAVLLADSDIQGGAALGAYRLHQGLQAIGVESQMLVRNRRTSDPTVVAQGTLLGRLRPRLDQLPLHYYRQRTGLFSPQWMPDGLIPRIRRLQPDVVSINWVANGFLSIETLGQLRVLGVPLVLTLRDMWALTGGCHYSQDCERYTQFCGQCPQLGSPQTQDLSHWVWQRKARAWQDLPLTLVAPSRWMADRAAQSPLLQHCRVAVIPHSLDPQLYQPMPQGLARQALGLPQDRPLVLFGALDATTDRRKGYHLLAPALQQVALPNLELVVFGAQAPTDPSALDMGRPTHYLGRLDGATLAQAYAAADVMVVPSLQEVFAKTAAESLACGTPVVAFGGTGLADIVDHQQTGYLARPFEVADLAAGIAWVLESDAADRHRLRQAARTQALERFSLAHQAAQYRDLFEDLGAR